MIKRCTAQIVNIIKPKLVDAKLQARVLGHFWVKHYLKCKKKNKKSRGLPFLFVQILPLNWQGKFLIEKISQSKTNRV